MVAGLLGGLLIFLGGGGLSGGSRLVGWNIFLGGSVSGTGVVGLGGSPERLKGKLAV